MLNKIFAVAAATTFAATAFAQAPAAGPAAGPTAGPTAAPAVAAKPAATLEKKLEAPKVEAAKAVDGAKTKATHAHKHAGEAAKQAAESKPTETAPTK